jgi:hypothetical protein
MTQHLFGESIRISDPAPFGRPGHADSSFTAVQEFAFHVR